MNELLRAVDFAECCRRIGISRRAGERLRAEGCFPIPAQPLDERQKKQQRPRRTYSTYYIDLYLREAAVDDIRPRRLQVLRSVR